jgi:Mn-dependent DtxR family transcriptional regulator
MGQKNTACRVTKTNSDKIVIPFEDVIERLKKIESKDDDGFTTEDMANHFGWSKNWVNKNIRDLVKHGLVECTGRRTIQRTDGIKCHVPTYGLVEL